MFGASSGKPFVLERSVVLEQRCRHVAYDQADRQVVVADAWAPLPAAMHESAFPT